MTIYGVELMSLFRAWKDEWLKENQDKQRTITYNNHIDKFVEYLELEKKGDSPINVSIEDVVNCVGYNNQRGKMNSINTMRTHVESVKAFYTYLQSKGLASNIFSEVNDTAIFYQQIVDKFHLVEQKESDFLESDKIIELLCVLEKGVLSEQYLTLSEGRKEKYLRELGVCLFVKVSLIYPAKRQDICNIKISQFKNDFRELHVSNKYTTELKLYLPNAFRNEVKRFIYQREQELQRKVCEDELIFQFLLGESFELSDINTWLYYFLKQNGIVKFVKTSKKKSSYSSEAIRNTVITSMVSNGMNPALISKVSNMSIGTLEDRYYKDGIKIDNEEDIINSEINKLGFMYYM